MPYLDKNGLAYLWDKIKEKISSEAGPLKMYPVGSIYLSVNNISPATLFGGTWQQITDTFLLAAGSSYPAGRTGGSATNSHTHTVNSHTHTGPSHTHTMAHTHTGPSHTHTMAHTHTVSGKAHTHSGSGVLVYFSPDNTNDKVWLNWAETGGNWAYNGYLQSLAVYTNNVSGTTPSKPRYLNCAGNTGSTTPGSVTSGASSAANTGSSGTGKTGASSAANTGSSGTGNTGAASPGTGNPTDTNNMPPYLAVYVWKRTA